MRYPTTPMVAAAWLATLSGITAAMVGTTLPANDNTSWAASGFITINPAGGLADLYLPVAHPVVTLKFWAVDPDTGLPPWDKAIQLAETVRAGCLGSTGTGQIVTLPYSPQNARVLSAYLMQEPRQAFADAGDYACWVADMALHWAAH